MNLPLFPSHPDCRSCERWELAPRNPGVPTIRWGLPGPGSPVLIAIGPAPGYYDHVDNAPFSGKPGRLLRSIALANLSTLCTIYLTMMVRCGVEPDAKSRHYKSCYSHHDADLSAILAAHPSDFTAILLLGADATAQFHRLHFGKRLSHKDAMSSNGRPLLVHGRPIPVFSTLNPAAILRNNSLIHTLEDHVELLTATILGHAPIPTDPVILPARSPNRLA